MQRLNWDKHTKVKVEVPRDDPKSMSGKTWQILEWLISTITIYASPKMGWNQVFGGVSLPS